MVEKYLIEIAQEFNVEYEPDPMVMNQEEVDSAGKKKDYVKSLHDHLYSNLH